MIFYIKQKSGCKNNTQSHFFSYLLCLCLLFFFSFDLSAQPRAGGRDDSEVARQYVNWILQEMEEGRISDAQAALQRALDFADVSSDISYLKAHFLMENSTRHAVISALDMAINTARWEVFNENLALQVKIEQLIAIREYNTALDLIETLPVNADSAVQRLRVLRVLAAKGDVTFIAQLRSHVLTSMDRYPRDPRPLKIFFEYANNRTPMRAGFDSYGLTQNDLNLMELVLRRLPFLLEEDQELAWMAVSFFNNTEDARRLLASYRSGGIRHIQNRDFRPHPGSIAAALNLGLIGDIEAADELFSGTRGFNHSLPPEISLLKKLDTDFSFEGFPVLDLKNIVDVYSLLRSEEGRDYFTGKLLSFSGLIIKDEDNDGFYDTFALYDCGTIISFSIDFDQDINYDFAIIFNMGGSPFSAVIPVADNDLIALIKWESFPFVQSVSLGNEEFKFGPADFQFSPVTFTELGGSRTRAGLLYPVFSFQNMNLTRRTFILSCNIMVRPSIEFEGAVETFYLDRGIPFRAEETLDGRVISNTVFERGIPVTQRLDLDNDGRMETLRTFRPPSAGFLEDLKFTDYRQLTASSQSDWRGDGRFMTRQLYLEDGSVVFYFDADGSGELNYRESGN